MPVLYVYDSPWGDVNIYDRVNASIDEPPEGCIFHVACERDDGGLFVVEGWENEAAQERWSSTVDEKIKQAGGPGRPEPKKYRVHNMRFANEADVRG